MVQGSELVSGPMATSPEDAPVEKLGLALALLAFWLVGYFGTAGRLDLATAGTFRTVLDDAIPFLPVTIYAYAAVYTAMLLPAFTVRCRRLFRRVCLAYACVIAVSLALFNAMPITSLGLRPDDADLAALAPERFDVWGVRLCYALDPPLNLFPSLHLASVTLVSLAAWTARPIYGAMGLVLTAAVAISICTVKQHWVVDGVAGLGLGAGAWALFVRPYPSPGGPGVAYGARGPAGYALLHASAMAVLYLLFRSGHAR